MDEQLGLRLPPAYTEIAEDKFSAVDFAEKIAGVSFVLGLGALGLLRQFCPDLNTSGGESLLRSFSEIVGVSLTAAAGLSIGRFMEKKGNRRGDLEEMEKIYKEHYPSL